jgi:hypothetical protein
MVFVGGNNNLFDVICLFSFFGYCSGDGGKVDASSQCIPHDPLNGSTFNFCDRHRFSTFSRSG